MAFSSANCYLIVTVTIVQVIARYVHVRIDLNCRLSLIHHSNREFGSGLSKCRNRGFLMILSLLKVLELKVLDLMPHPSQLETGTNGD